MTTIAYRDGTMAADSGSWMGDASHGWAKKIVRDDEGTLYGGCGHAPEIAQFFTWVESGRQGEPPAPRQVKDDESSYIIMRVKLGGPVELLTAYGSYSYDAPYFAMGAGSATAFGALWAGATAADAIEATKEHGASTFGKVYTLSHHLNEVE